MYTIERFMPCLLVFLNVYNGVLKLGKRMTALLHTASRHRAGISSRVLSKGLSVWIDGLGSVRLFCGMVGFFGHVRMYVYCVFWFRHRVSIIMEFYSFLNGSLLCVGGRSVGGRSGCGRFHCMGRALIGYLCAIKLDILSCW